MREFIKREAKQTVTVREVPERVVKELDAIWERLGFEDTQIKVNTSQSIFYRLISKSRVSTTERQAK